MLKSLSEQALLIDDELSSSGIKLIILPNHCFLLSTIQFQKNIT